LANLRARLVFAATGDARSAAIKLDQGLIGGKVFSSNSTALSNSLRAFLAKERAGKHAGMAGLLTVSFS